MGILTTIAGIGANFGLNQAGQAIQGKRSYKYSRKMADYTYSKDLEMWNRFNEYNLPINQMQRLEEAGLNPNMMYGTGQGANVSKEMPKYTNPQGNFSYTPMDVTNILSAFQDIKVKQAQVDNIKAQTESRQIDNRVKANTVDSAIRTAIANAGSAETKRALQDIKYIIEMEFQQNYDSEGNWIGTGSTRQRMAELEKTQASARSVSADADLKEQEAALYRELQKVLPEGKAGVLSTILRTLISNLGRIK